MLTEASVSSAALISTGVADVLTTIPKQSSSGENFNAGSIRRLSCSIVVSKWSGQLLGKSLKDVINFQPSSPRSGAQMLLTLIGRLGFPQYPHVLLQIRLLT